MVRYVCAPKDHSWYSLTIEELSVLKTEVLSILFGSEVEEGVLCVFLFDNSDEGSKSKRNVA